MRVQVILALVAALVVVAVPLYLWRRPQPAGIPSADAATASSAPILPAPAQGPFSPGLVGTLPGGLPQMVGKPSGPQIEVAPVKTLKCQNPGPGRTPPERCDGVRVLEDNLVRAIKDSAACAPPSKSGYVVSYVLEAHFGKKRTNLSFGKSTTLSKSRRRELLRCVERALPVPEWERIPHQHQRYMLNAIATYPASADPSAEVPDAAPKAPASNPSPGKAKPKKATDKTAPKKPAAGKPAKKPG